VDGSIRIALWVRRAGEAESFLISQRRCQSGWEVLAAQVLILQEVMTLPTHPLGK